jgi:hypothetical protein
MLVGTNIKEFYKVTLDLGPLFNPYPSFQFQTSQSQETLLNQGLNIIPQYLMHGIQSNMAIISIVVVKALFLKMKPKLH